MWVNLMAENFAPVSVLKLGIHCDQLEVKEMRVRNSEIAYGKCSSRLRHQLIEIHGPKVDKIKNSRKYPGENSFNYIHLYYACLPLFQSVLI